jgi:triphosphoribosyl-dephospho-CoA synthase
MIRSNQCFVPPGIVVVTLAEQIELACLMEATARKPGNVHPAAAFDDLCYEDFVRAAHAVAEPLSAIRDHGLGPAIYNSVQVTRDTTGTNVNLGIILLFAPVAGVSVGDRLEDGLPSVLRRTTVEDAEQVYAAISLAQPGGMGKTASQDISQRPTVTLYQAMSLAADRDRIAEQYVNDFKLVFAARRVLCELLKDSTDWEAAVVRLHIWIMSRWPDTLIARKCGVELAEKASLRARLLIDHAEVAGKFDLDQLGQFDAWLRADGHRRNPGTTADLVAATLFAAMRDGLINAPSRDAVLTLAKSISLGNT